MPRTNFNSSGFIRVLSDLAVLDGSRSTPAFTERLSQWMGVSDAITLFGALAPAAAPPALAGSGARVCLAAEREVSRARAALAAAIKRSCAADGAEARLKFPLPLPDTADEIAAYYTAVHRFYTAHQREMDAVIGPLRARLRRTLAEESQPLRQLAGLDGALDEILVGRERRLFASVPVLLEKRFEHLRAAHQATLAAKGEADDAGRWLEPGGWLAAFRAELQAVLLAELELRLQPLLGLIEAFSNEVNKSS